MRSTKEKLSLDQRIFLSFKPKNDMLHSKEFSGNQGKHQNFDPTILPYKFGLIFMGMKQKIFFFFGKKKSS